MDVEAQVQLVLVLSVPQASMTLTVVLSMPHVSTTLVVLTLTQVKDGGADGAAAEGKPKQPRYDHDGDISKVANVAVTKLKALDTPLELGGEKLMFETAFLQVWGAFQLCSVNMRAPLSQ